MTLNILTYLTMLKRRFWLRISFYAGLSCFLVATTTIGLILILSDYMDYEESLKQDVIDTMTQEVIQKNLPKLSQTLAQQDFNELVDRSNEIISTLQNYQRPIYIPETQDIDYYFSLSSVSDTVFRITLNDSANKELVSISSGKIPLSTGPDNTITAGYISSQPINFEGQHLGTAKIEVFSHYSLAKALSVNLGLSDGPWIVFTILSSLVGGLSGLIIGWHMTKRLDRIAAVTREWSAGHLDKRIKDTHNDELADHVKDLNRVADDLNELVLLRQEVSAHNEREHLAKELHDTVKQQVFALALQIKALSKHPLLPDALVDRVKETNDTVAVINSEIVKLLSEARPSTQTQTNFIQSLVDIIPSYTNRISIALLYDEDTLMMSHMQEHQLLRITQEALNNCIKHSKATEVTVRLKREGNIWSLTIKDNGVGFDIDNAKKGFGLNNMHERAAIFYGQLAVDSHLKKGTSVAVSWKATVQTSKL